MSPAPRLRQYLERQRDAFGTLSDILDRQLDSIRRGDCDLLAVQAAAERSAVDELAGLERSIRALRALRAEGRGEAALAGLEEAVGKARQAALQRNRRNREALGAALAELRPLIQELQGRPRTPASPFTDIGRPTMVDLLS
jgi:hypothetical protein